MPWHIARERGLTHAETLTDHLTCGLHDHSAIEEFAERVVADVGQRVAADFGGEFDDLEVLNLPKIYLPNGDELSDAAIQAGIGRHLKEAIQACSTEEELDTLACEECSSAAAWEDRLTYYLTC